MAGLGASGHPDAGTHGAGQPVGVSFDVEAPVPPGGGHLAHQIEEHGPREVGPAEERPPVGGQEHRHRPPAPPALRLDRLHVDGVDVGTFLPVHLDVHEQVVHHLGDADVLEAFVGHDVAPVAGGVPDGQEDGPVQLLGLGPGRFAPWVPLDRVVTMLAQVGAGLVGQVVHQASLRSGSRRTGSRHAASRRAGPAVPALVVPGACRAGLPAAESRQAVRPRVASARWTRPLWKCHPPTPPTSGPRSCPRTLPTTTTTGSSPAGARPGRRAVGRRPGRRGRTARRGAPRRRLGVSGWPRRPIAELIRPRTWIFAWTARWRW